MLSLFANATAKTPYKSLPADEAWRLLRNPPERVKRIIERLRAEPDEYKAKEIKCELPAITWSGSFSRREAAGLVEHSGLYVYDIDDYGDVDACCVELTRLQEKALPWIVGGFVSPSGTGFKVVLAGPTVEAGESATAAHKAAWHAGAALLRASCGWTLDAAADPCRLCFLGNGEGVWTAAYYEPFTVEEGEGAGDGEADNPDGVTVDDIPEPTKRSLPLDTVRDMLWTVGADRPYAQWRNLLWAVIAEVGKDDDVVAMLERWSQETGGERGHWSAKDRRHFHDLIKAAGDGEGVTIATLVKLAKEKGWVDWRQRLKRNQNGKVIKSQFNIDVLLKHHRAIKGRFRMDIFSGTKEVAPCADSWFHPKGVPVERWSALDMEVGFEREYNINVGTADQWLLAMEGEAVKHPYNPRVDYLNGLPAWDGVERVKDLWVKGFGAERTDLGAAVARCWLCAAVKRQFAPGTPFQIVPVLKGPGGTGKTEGLKILAGNPFWMVNSKIDMSSKEGYSVVQGGWIVELAEMANMKRTDQEEIKGFVTQTHCRFRKPWDRNPSDVAATWVFVGTTNEDHFLKDMTGNRRWIPLEVKGFDDNGKEGLQWLAAHRDQLWAEACHYLKGGAAEWDLNPKWYVDARRAQDNALYLSEVDVAIGEMTGQYERIGKEATLSIREIGTAVGYEARNRLEEMQIAAALKHYGWKRDNRAMVNGVRVIRWRYTPPL